MSDTPQTQAIIDALRVLMFSPTTAEHILRNDPKAFEQAEAALNAIGANCSGMYESNAAREHIRARAELFTPTTDHKGALPVLRQLDAAVYAGIICNPENNLAGKHWDAIAAAHSEALKVFRCVDAFAN